MKKLHIYYILIVASFGLFASLIARRFNLDLNQEIIMVLIICLIGLLIIIYLENNNNKIIEDMSNKTVEDMLKEIAKFNNVDTWEDIKVDTWKKYQKKEEKNHVGFEEDENFEEFYTKLIEKYKSGVQRPTAVKIFNNAYIHASGKSSIDKWYFG
ncbi:MAG: hypothetical protein ACRC5R_00465 [Mycoplasmatales bacterium]